MSLRRFLRYNSSHRLWFPRGYRGWWMPRLNPMESCSHGKDGKRTFDVREPLWLYQLRQRLFCMAGRHRCGRRGESHIGMSKAYGGDEPLPDTWDRGPDGNRTCSYCGSIHPYDLMTICGKVSADERYGVEGTTKGYKYYVKQPGVRNAGEGAIKFYIYCAPDIVKNLSNDDENLFEDAIRITRKRWDAYFAQSRNVAQLAPAWPSLNSSAPSPSAQCSASPPASPSSSMSSGTTGARCVRGGPHHAPRPGL